MGSEITGGAHGRFLIIPIIVAGGMINAFAVLIAQGFGLQELYNMDNSWLWLFRKMGGNTLGTLMIPMLAASMAYSWGIRRPWPPASGWYRGQPDQRRIPVRYVRRPCSRICSPFFEEGSARQGCVCLFCVLWAYPVFSTLIVEL